MTKKLSKKELFKLIKEAVTKKINLLREDIDIDDDEIWDYYDDNLDNDWNNNTSKEFMKEEVDMGQIPAVSDIHSTAKEYSPEVKKEIRKLRYMIDDYAREGKDTSELTKRIQKLKQQ